MKNRPAMISAIVGTVVVALIAVFIVADGGQEDTTKLIGQPVPVINTVDIDDRAFRTSDYLGRFLLVNFFGTWCPPCIVEHPELVAFSQEHEAAGTASVVSVAYNDTTEAIRKFFDDHGGDWPILNPADASFVVQFGIVALPESYLVDPSGTVVHKFVGGVTRAEINEQIEKFS